MSLRHSLHLSQLCFRSNGNFDTSLHRTEPMSEHIISINVVRAMHEVGIDISKNETKDWIYLFTCFDKQFYKASARTVCAIKAFLNTQIKLAVSLWLHRIGSKYFVFMFFQNLVTSYQKQPWYKWHKRLMKLNAWNTHAFNIHLFKKS